MKWNYYFWVLALIPMCFKGFKVLPKKRDTAPLMTVYSTTKAPRHSQLHVEQANNPISRNNDKTSITHRSLVWRLKWPSG